MNSHFAFRLRSAGVRAALAGMLAVWLAQAGMSWAQFSTGESAPAVAVTPLEPPGPVVEGGILAPMVGKDAMSWPLPGKAWPYGKDEPAMAMPPVPFTPGGDAPDLFLKIAPTDGWLEPVDSLLPSLPAGPGIAGPEGGNTEAGPARLQIGNVAFNRVANSLNVRETEVPKADDLSRQFQVGLAAPNVVESVPIGGWSVLGIAALAVVVAMAVGYYENNRHERRRRRPPHHRHHRRRRTS